jgi:hypothetical protein
MTGRLLAALAPLAFLAFIARPSIAHACAPAPAAGQKVNVSREDALIVWDEPHHLEHFVRNAVFETTAKSFGFLVPTPTRPQLAEARDTAFETLRWMTRPWTVHQTEWAPFPIGCTMLPFMMMARSKEDAVMTSAAQAVTVVEQKRVAGLDAAVLSATDSEALAAWLRDHGFEMRDSLQRWLATYVARKWMITAFRYTRPEIASNGPVAVDHLSASAVRLSFQTDAPVYPYLEPDDTAAVPGRELHLFVASGHRMEGTLADDGDKPWAASTFFAAPVDGAEMLASALPGVDLPARLWVDERTDFASKRVASDLVFRQAPADVEARRPPLVEYERHEVPLPYELPLVIGGVWWWRRRKRARGTATTPKTPG